jgi:signal transduction histidine kinase
MALDQFLSSNRAQILAASETRVVALAALRPTSAQLQLGLSLFLDQLIEVLRKNSKAVGTQDEAEISDIASCHGRELLRLGYTLTHVVHSYGAMCQAITEVAAATKAPVTALEFHQLNRCLDIAIAGAVTEFESLKTLESKNREVVHLGTVAHELRNALNRARISFEMIAKGMVGIGGSTSRILEHSLQEMDVLINRSLSEVRLRADTDLNVQCFSVIDVVSQLIVTAEIEAATKSQTLTVSVDPAMYVNTDRHLILAAIGNLIQNAMKFTKVGGNISVLGIPIANTVVIKVQDQCGGIPADKIGGLFKPFVQQNTDRTGLGLGLLISKEAIEKCGGSLVVENTTDGCCFTVTLPRTEFPLAIKPVVVV